MSREELRRVTDRIRTQLTIDYIYQHMQVRVLDLDRDKLGFWVEIPILSGDTFITWDISVAPFYHEGTIRRLVPEMYRVGVGLNSGAIIPQEACHYEGPSLCPAPIKYTGMVCVEGLLSQDADKIAKCSTVAIPEPEKTVVRISDTVIMVFSQGETVQERCPKGRIQSVPVEARTYVLIGKVGCVLSSTANWQFQPLLIHNMRVNVTDLFVLDGIDVPLVIPIPTQRVVPTFQEIDIENIVLRHQAKLPDLSKMHKVQIFNTTGSAAGLTALPIVLILFILAIIVYRKVRQRQRAAMIKVKPTTETPPTAPAPVAASPGKLYPSALTATDTV